MIDMRALDAEFRVVAKSRCDDTETAVETVRATFRTDETSVIAHIELWAWDMPGQVIWHSIVTRGEEL